ncbi:MAG: LexA family transcriptional regulator [Christiangramia sp.]|uniref:LexA family transcriptional regulator n=1 Tax=Christiangramia sp. TaxID=1931228 RepID=UPI003242E5F8
MYLSQNIKSLRVINGLSQGELGKQLGCTRDNVASYERGTEPKLEILLKIVNYFHIPLENLVNDDLSDYSVHEINTFKIDKEGRQRYNTFRGDKTEGDLINDHAEVFKLRTDKDLEDQLIPLYNVEASAGLVELFKNHGKTNVIDTIKIPNLPKCDGAVFVTGDSMYPLLKSGDIVAYKEIQDFENDIFWGEMYLISVEVAGEEWISVKYIQKSEKGEQYVKLVSQNQNHQPKDVKLSKVRALALVKASIRINSMS